MKITDAYWEKRNLGVSTTKFTIEDHDTVEDIKEIFDNCRSEFQVLRLPYYFSRFLFPVQDFGFRYVEDMFSLKNDLHPIEMNPIVERLYKEISFDHMDNKDIEQLLDEIERGMFNTDYIFIDPAFNTKLGCRRYYNWVKDELERGSLFFKYMYKGKVIGFNALKEKSDGIYDALMGGIYTEFQKTGLANAVFVVDIVRSLGGRCVTADVSSNNTKQIKNLLQKGFVITSSYHVFVKHMS